MRSFWAQIFLGLFTLVTITACLTSCENFEQKQKPLVLLLLTAYENEFFRDIDKGFHAGLSRNLKRHYQIDIKYGTSVSSVSAQRQILDNYIARYVNMSKPILKAVVLAPTTSNDELTAQIKQLREHGVPVVLVDVKIDPEALLRAGTDYDAFVGSDNSKGGALAADIIVRALPQGGTILVLNGFIGSLNAQLRHDGFIKRLHELTAKDSYKYVMIERTGNWKRTEGRAVVDGLLTMGKHIDGIFAANDEMALGALEALRQTRCPTKPVVVGFDAIDEAVAAVKEKKLAATIAQDPFGMGRQAAIVVDEILNHQPVPKDQPTAVRAIYLDQSSH